MCWNRVAAPNPPADAKKEMRQVGSGWLLLLLVRFPVFRPEDSGDGIQSEENPKMLRRDPASLLPGLEEEKGLLGLERSSAKE